MDIEAFVQESFKKGKQNVTLQILLQILEAEAHHQGYEDD